MLIRAFLGLYELKDTMVYQEDKKGKERKGSASSL